MSLTNLLPSSTKEDEARERKLRQRPVSALVKAFVTAPPYGQRRGWVPCNPEDFGDGGVSPEIHVAQYPLGMGMKGKESTSNASAVQLDAQGKVKYDLAARQGHDKDKIVYSKLSDLLPSEITNEEDPTLQRPLDDEINELIDRTKKIGKDNESEDCDGYACEMCEETSSGSIHTLYIVAKRSIVQFRRKAEAYQDGGGTSRSFGTTKLQD